MKITGLTIKTLYQKRMFMLWWFVGLFAMTIFTLLFFPSLKNSNIAQSFNSLPKAVQKIAGNGLSFRSIGGYISQEIFALRIPLLTIILSIALYNSIVAGEEQRGILETQLTLPLSRNRILGSKLISGIFIIAIVSLGTFLGVLAGLLIIKEHYAVTTIFRLTVLCALIGLDFGLFNFMLGAVFGRKGLALGISSGIAFLSYLITSLASSTPSLVSVEKLSLFHYYQTTGGINPRDIVVLLATGFVLIIIGFIFFSKRDIKSS